MKIDADTKQRLTTASIFLIELAKVSMGSFLVVFVPRECNQGDCSVIESISDLEISHLIALVINGICFLSFVILYIVEVQRENFCIEFLDIDESKSENYLDDQIESYPMIKKNMKQHNVRYRFMSIFTIIIFSLNVISSLIDISNTNTDDTYSPLLSFILLLSQKLYSAYETSSLAIKHEKALSAYMKKPTCYNIIDNDYEKK